MFTIYDGRAEFYQWDVEQKLIVEDSTIDEVHFCNRTDTCSLVCEVYNEGELRVVNVPNILLQQDWRINVYAYCTNYTKHSAVFNVRKRSKPADYMYTETEVKTWDALEERVAYLEENGAGGGTADLSGYYTKEEVDELIPDVSGFITAIPDEYVTETELEGKGYLTEHQSLEGYAKTDDIPDVSGFLNEEQVLALIEDNMPASGDEVSY